MKRFEDTEMWAKPWFRRLPPPYKAFWQYLRAKCDNSGVWVKDLELASIFIGAEIEEEKTLALINNGKERIRVFDNGEKWFIVEFVCFQCGITHLKELSIKSNPHLQILRLLRKHGLLQGYGKGRANLKDKDKDKDKGKDKDKVKVFKYGTFKESNNKEFKDYLKSKYPEVDIELEFVNMETWIRTNPRKGQKENYAKFARNWISKAAKDIEAQKPKVFRPDPPPPEKPDGLPKEKPVLTKEEEEDIHKERLALQRKIRDKQRKQEDESKERLALQRKTKDQQRRKNG